MRPRAPRKIAEYYKAKDPDTVITETLIRRLMDAGEIPFFNNGVKRVTSIEAVDAWLESKLGGGIVHE